MTNGEFYMIEGDVPNLTLDAIPDVIDKSLKKF